MAVKKSVNNSAYDMLLELVNKYGVDFVLIELFSSYLDTDSKAEFITNFMRYWETPKDIFDTEDLHAVEVYASIHCYVN